MSAAAEAIRQRLGGFLDTLAARLRIVLILY